MARATPEIIGQGGTIATRWAIVVAIVWLVRYLTLAHFPWQRPLWADWFDQGRYLLSATAFAHGDLTASAHWYPLGYALVAAPFAWLSPRDPFVLPDLLLYVATCAAFVRVAARLAIGTWPAVLCFLATTLVQTGLAGAWAQPWTTTLSAALIWWLIERTIAICEGRDDRLLRGLAIVGLLAAALPLVRPVDLLLSAECLAVAAGALIHRRRLSVSTLLVLAGAVLLPWAFYAVLHLAIYGPHPSAYMIAAAQTGFVPSDLGWKTYALLLHPAPWYPRSTAMLAALPWMVPGLAGLIAHAVVGGRRHAAIIGVLLALMLPISLLMLTYADLQPPGLWTFGNIHYFKWIMPIFGIGILLCLRLVQRRRGRHVVIAAMFFVVLPLGIRLRPVRVGEQVPARLLLFKGDGTRDWSAVYFSAVTIDDDGGAMAHVNDFHQLPDANGVGEIAVRRLFLGHPRRTDAGDATGSRGARPYARFATRLSYLGLP